MVKVKVNYLNIVGKDYITHVELGEGTKLTLQDIGPAIGLLQKFKVSKGAYEVLDKKGIVTKIYV